VPSDRPEGAGLALVTGSSSGIGRAVAERLLAGGWQVCGLDAQGPALAHAAYRHEVVDLTQAPAIDALCATLPTPQSVVHAAGVLRTGSVGSLKAEDATLMWQVHTQAATRLANALLPRMAQVGSGRLVLIGSRVAQGMPGRSQYAASKAALVALARSWATEVVAQGVTVNIVSPAATDTAMLRDPARAANAPKLPPIGRLIQPQEVAALVAYLLSPEAAAITGQDIALCGGSSLPR